MPYLVFPLYMFLGMAAAVLGLRRNIDPALVVTGVAAAGTAVVIVLERVMPYRRAWNQPTGNLLADGGLSFLSMILIPELTRFLVLGGSVWVLGSLAGGSLWPEVSLGAQVILAILIAELANYITHRLMHQGWLWRLHAVHHSAPQLYWLNTGRFHPIEAFLSYLVVEPLLIWLGCPLEVVALQLTWISLGGVLQHSNTDHRLGPLNWIFAMGEMHRWHHAPDRRDANTNFGITLILWDVVFGTRHLPEHPVPETLGVPLPKTLWGLLAAPFQSERWKS